MRQQGQTIGPWYRRYLGLGRWCKYEHRTITGGVGHNLPQEAPEAFAQAVIDVDKA
jgi:pimeloyl-ACP methyl ester carboxylesterase